MKRGTKEYIDALIDITKKITVPESLERLDVIHKSTKSGNDSTLRDKT